MTGLFETIGILAIIALTLYKASELLGDILSAIMSLMKYILWFILGLAIIGILAHATIL